MAGATSLDYTAVQTTFDIYGVELTPRLFSLVQELEIQTLNKKTQ
jgi:hypothetical protein